MDKVAPIYNRFITAATPIITVAPHSTPTSNDAHRLKSQRVDTRCLSRSPDDGAQIRIIHRLTTPLTMKRFIFAFILALTTISAQSQSFLGIPYGTPKSEAESILREQYGKQYESSDDGNMITDPIIGGILFDYATVFFTEDRVRGEVLDGGCAFVREPLKSIGYIKKKQNELIEKLKERYGESDVVVTIKRNGDKSVDFSHIRDSAKAFGALFISREYPTPKGKCALVLLYRNKLKTEESDL